MEYVKVKINSYTIWYTESQEPIRQGKRKRKKRRNI